MHRLIWLLIVVLPACAAPPAGGLIEFIASRRDLAYQRVPREVLAFYYTWYGTPDHSGRMVHWGNVDTAARDVSESTHYPAGGVYDSNDPALIDRHIAAAKAAGVTGFIATWWGRGTFEDKALAVVMPRAEAAGFKVCAYWETAPGTGEAQIARAADDLAYLVERFGSSPAYLKVDGRPVIFVYGRVMNEVPLGAWPAIVARAKARTGVDVALIADGYSDINARVFDGIHTYNPVGDLVGRTPDQMREYADRALPGAVAIARRHARISCLTIIPGYDDTKIREPGLNCVRHDGQTYDALWRGAIAADCDWVLITSWNEWHEGSEIEPSAEHGDLAMRQTRQYAPTFTARPPVAVAPPTPGGIDPALAAALRAKFAGKTFGIFPDGVGPVAIWLADCGLAVRELSWDELLDPTRFTPATVPYLVYAGGENYRQSVRRPRDVDQAVIAYLRSGGTLVCLPAMPFPFFYNEEGRGIGNAMAFGLPIGGGWEQPPAGALTFHADRDRLGGLPEEAAFPATGDLRWRPIQPGRLQPGDRVTPLITLRDAGGADLGLGAAVIELKATEPVGGRVVYAWMRLADVYGEATFWSAMLEAIAGW